MGRSEQPDEEMSELIQRAFNHYEELKYLSLSCVPDNIVPILYFGDYLKYKNSNPKIVTAALNPAIGEFFQKNTKEISDTCIFKDIAKGYHEDSRPIDYDEYYKCMNCYFTPNYKGESTPHKWFTTKAPGEELQKVFDATYYSASNPVLHTDIATPVATDPIWGRVNSRSKKVIIPSGFKLWKDLIGYLRPDILLIMAGGRPQNRNTINTDYHIWENCSVAKKLITENIRVIVDKSNLDAFTVNITPSVFSDTWDESTNVYWAPSQNILFGLCSSHPEI